MSDLGGAVVGALAGAIFGSIFTLTWEYVLRPRQERRKVAATLRVEVAANRQDLLSLQSRLGDMPTGLPPDMGFDTAVFDGLIDYLGALKVDELVPVVDLYSKLRYLNQISDLYANELDHSQLQPETSTRRMNALVRLQNSIDAVMDTLPVAIGLADSAFNALNRVLPKGKDRLSAPRLDVEEREQARQRALRDKQR
jgi:hypothetical protein